MVASVLTNSSAMIALQTLRTTNSELEEVNNQISTGKKVATAQDSAAVFAITKVMESDVAGFEAISVSLALGSATVGVASAATAQIGDLLEEIKQKVVAAQEDNVDRDALQDEVDSLVEQVDGIVSAAQFNGLNLLDGSVGSIDILSSLDRSATGVTSSSITVDGVDLSSTGGAAPTGFTGTGTTGITANATSTAFVLASGATTGDVAINTGGLAAGQQFRVSINGQEAVYTVTADDVASANTEDRVANGIATAINNLGITDVLADVDGTDPSIVEITNSTGADIVVTATAEAADAGGLAALGNINISSTAAAADLDAALTNIETVINEVVDAQAAFGVSETRLELQQDFMSNLIDSFKVGIGALVDADLEEASARLQALQVQQQLGIQSLSIANQAPQNLLALFQ